MSTIDFLPDHPYLGNTVYAYLCLGALDVIHHWHAAAILNDEPAIHAVYVGLLLLPISMATIVLFARHH